MGKKKVKVMFDGKLLKGHAGHDQVEKAKNMRTSTLAQYIRFGIVQSADNALVQRKIEEFKIRQNNSKK
ncbi:hypothetical protein KYLE_82 [Pantoea phage Kyle]|uniref:Uncharacterized protein n=1 Tax=Pantoea phage Kyle TaxID=2589665 RepID=A0A514A8Q8_9CAUD|nr:hypothetical protein HWC52_gp082 [Pantoea phage Kyle]QDH49657.1 hypothetical protein KYLE_82 [Pantoea phage Kyle]